MFIDNTGFVYMLYIFSIGDLIWWTVTVAIPSINDRKYHVPAPLRIGKRKRFNVTWNKFKCLIKSITKLCTINLASKIIPTKRARGSCKHCQVLSFNSIASRCVPKLFIYLNGHGLTSLMRFRLTYSRFQFYFRFTLRRLHIKIYDALNFPENNFNCTIKIKHID